VSRKVDLVEDDLDRHVAGADLGEDVVHSSHLLAEHVLGQRRVDDVEDEVGDERLLERRREPFDELRRQPPDEPDGVGDEIALARVVESACRRVEGLEEPVLDGHLGTRQRVEQGRLPDVRVPRERDRRRLRAAPGFPAGRTVGADVAETASKKE
jgi:hypothetical protein